MTVRWYVCCKWLQRHKAHEVSAWHAGSPLGTSEHVFSSMCAGAVVSFVASPTELIKCRLQHQGTYASAILKHKEWEQAGKKGPAPTLYRGPIDVLRTVYTREAGLRGLSNGLGATLVREIPGNGIMFGVYEGLKKQFASWKVQLLCVAHMNMLPATSSAACRSTHHTTLAGQVQHPQAQCVLGRIRMSLAGFATHR